MKPNDTTPGPDDLDPTPPAGDGAAAPQPVPPSVAVRHSRTLSHFAGDERVEARLLEFLEGELTGPEADEIEAHLARNPHQRQLMQELAATRTAVASLPRNAAPLEIFDAVQARLERGALLDEPAAQNTAKATRPKLLPQVLAVSGITAAAASLAWVVFVVISPPKSPESAVAMATPSLAPVPQFADAKGGGRGVEKSLADNVLPAASVRPEDPLARAMLISPTTRPSVEVAESSRSRVDQQSYKTLETEQRRQVDRDRTGAAMPMQPAPGPAPLSGKAMPGLAASAGGGMWMGGYWIPVTPAFGGPSAGSSTGPSAGPATRP